jgi:hypothetical protein
MSDHSENCQYLHDCIERQSDTSLMELQTELREVFNITVSLPTVLRSLQREGYTMKTVCFHVISHRSPHLNDRSRVGLLSETSKTVRSTRPSSPLITVPSSLSLQTRATSTGSLLGGRLRGHSVANALASTSSSCVAPNIQYYLPSLLMGSYTSRLSRMLSPTTFSANLLKTSSPR